MRRFAAIVLQVALLALPLSGIRTQVAHCADADHAPATTMDMQCHNMLACATVVMRAEAPVRMGPSAPADVPRQPLAREHGTVKRAPEPPPPRA